MDEELLLDFDSFQGGAEIPPQQPASEAPIAEQQEVMPTAQTIQDAPIEQAPIQDEMLSDFDTFTQPEAQQQAQPIIDPIDAHRPEGVDDDFWEDVKGRVGGFLEKAGKATVALSPGLSNIVDFGKMAKSEITQDENSKTREALKVKSQYDNIQATNEDLTNLVSGYVSGNQESLDAIKTKRTESNNQIVSILREREIEAFDDNGRLAVVIKDENGEEELKYLDDEKFLKTLIEDIGAGGAEIAGALGAGVTATIASQKALPITTLPKKRIAVGAISGIAGSAVGAYSGRIADVIKNSISLNLEIDAMETLDKGADAALMDLGAGAIVGTSIKAGSKLAKPISEAIDRAKTLIKEGDIQGAKRVVKEDYGVTDKQIDDAYTEITKDVDYDKTLKGDDLLRAKLEAVVQMQPQGKTLITSAIRKNPKAAIETSKEISKRAEEVIKATDKFSKSPSALKKSVEAYEKAVGKNYGEVRGMIDEALPNYKPDVDMTTFKGTLDDLNSRVIDPLVKDKVTALADSLASQKTDTVGDLINVRQLFNKFYGKNKGHFESKTDKEALLSIQKTIDSKIDDAIGSIDDKGTGDALKEAFSDAKSKYADMFKTQDTATYNAIFKKGASEEDIGKSLVKYSKATDKDLDSVLSKLSPVQRTKAEFSILKQMVGEATAKGEAKAVDFRSLMDNIKTSTSTFKTPEAKQFIKNIESYDKKFGKDIDIQRIASGVSPKEEKNIATSFVGKIMMKISSLRFEAFQRLMPTEQGRRLSLQKSIESALEKSRTPREFFFNASKIKGMPNKDRQALKSAIKEIGEQEAKAKQALKMDQEKTAKEAKQKADAQAKTDAKAIIKAKTETKARADKAILTKKEFMKKKELSAQAKRAQEAKIENQVGISEEEAKQNVKNVFAKKQKDPYSNLRDEDIAELEEMMKQDKALSKEIKAVEESIPTDISGNPIFAQFGPELFTGSIAGFEEDEEGNITFDPAKFMLGFIGGHVAKRIATSPKITKKVKKELMGYAQRTFDKLDSNPKFDYLTGTMRAVENIEKPKSNLLARKAAERKEVGLPEKGEMIFHPERDKNYFLSSDGDVYFKRGNGQWEELPNLQFQRDIKFIKKNGVKAFKERNNEVMEDFVPEKIKDGYKDSHSAPSRGEDFTSIDDLTKIYPKDIYSINGANYYGHSEPKLDNSAMKILNRIKGNPDAMVTIYRSIPENIDAEINPTDWVTITKQYAKDHGDARFNGKYKMLQKRVRAGDIFTDGNSIHEQGYDPKPKK